MREVQVTSDRDGTRHTVTLDEHGVAKSCTCKFGQSGRRGTCYHMRRAIRAGEYVAALRLLVSLGVDGATVDATFEKLKSALPFEVALSRLVVRALDKARETVDVEVAPQVAAERPGITLSELRKRLAEVPQPDEWKRP